MLHRIGLVMVLMVAVGMGWVLGYLFDLLLSTEPIIGFLCVAASLWVIVACVLMTHNFLKKL